MTGLIQGGTLTGNMTVAPKVNVQANKNVTPSTSEVIATPDEGYAALAQCTVGAVSLQDKTVTPTSSEQVITADSGQGYLGLGTVTVEAASGGDTLDELLNDGTNPKTVNMTDDNVNHACYGVKAGFNVVLPNTVTTIEADAFKECIALLSISAPGVTEIKSYAFGHCYNLNSTEFPNVEIIRDSAFTGISRGDSDRYLRFPKLRKIEGSAFYSSYKISDIYIGYNGVCVLDETSAFNRSIGGFTVHVPNNQLANYQADATWADAVTNRSLTLVGDYA